MGRSYLFFAGFVEKQYVNRFDGTKPELYRRYIDDCFGSKSCGRLELDYFIYICNFIAGSLRQLVEVTATSKIEYQPQGR